MSSKSFAEVLCSVSDAGPASAHIAGSMYDSLISGSGDGLATSTSHLYQAVNSLYLGPEPDDNRILQIQSLTFATPGVSQQLPQVYGPSKPTGPFKIFPRLSQPSGPMIDS